MKILTLLLLYAFLASGCVSSSSSGVSHSERRELMKLTSERFEMPKDHIADVFGILRAVKSAMPDRKVDKITFDLMQGTTVYFAASEKDFLHGGPFAKATKVGEAWKIGEQWHIK